MISRRDFAALLAGAGVACSRRDPPGRVAPRSTSVGSAAPVSSAPAARLALEELTWSWESSEIGKMNVVVVLPERAPDERFPVLVTMHGTGEALKGPERGARG